MVARKVLGSNSRLFLFASAREPIEANFSTNRAVCPINRRLIRSLLAAFLEQCCYLDGAEVRRSSQRDRASGSAHSPASHFPQPSSARRVPPPCEACRHQ